MSVHTPAMKVIYRKTLMNLVKTILGALTVVALSRVGGTLWAGTLDSAAERGDVAKVKELLSQGVDVTDRDHDGETALH